METAQRIDLARQRLAALRATVEDMSLAAANLGPPCKECQHFEDGKCLNPVNHEAKITNFALVVGGSKKAEEMRAPNGLCGPEAVLFERMHLCRRIPWVLLMGIAWVAVWVGLGIFVAGPLAIMAIMGIVPIAVSLTDDYPL